MLVQFGGEPDGFQAAFRGKLDEWRRVGNTSHAPRGFPSTRSLVGKVLLAWSRFVFTYQTKAWLHSAHDLVHLDYYVALVESAVRAACKMT